MKHWQVSLSIIILTALMLSSAVFTKGYIGIFIFSLIINGTMAVSYDIPGRSHFISLGHAVFFGLGAYCFGIAISKGLSFFPGVIHVRHTERRGSANCHSSYGRSEPWLLFPCHTGYTYYLSKAFRNTGEHNRRVCRTLYPGNHIQASLQLTGCISAGGNRSMPCPFFPIPLGTLFQRNGSQRGGGRGHWHSHTNSEDPVPDDCRRSRLHGRYAPPGEELLRKSGFRIQPDSQYYSLAGFASCAGKGYIGSAAWCPAHYCSRRNHLDKI